MSKPTSCSCFGLPQLQEDPHPGALPVSAFRDVRFDLVASIQQRIAAGTYRVSAAMVAERLMARMMV